HAAVVVRQPGEERVPGALHVRPPPAGQAQSARRLRVQDHRVSDGHVGDTLTDGVHPARVLVADRVRQLRIHGVGPLALEYVQVGAAHPGTADLHDDVERAGQDRFRDVVQQRWLVVVVHPYGLHRISTFSLTSLSRSVTEPTPYRVASRLRHSPPLTSMLTRVPRTRRRCSGNPSTPTGEPV